MNSWYYSLQYITYTTYKFIYIQIYCILNNLTIWLTQTALYSCYQNKSNFPPIQYLRTLASELLLVVVVLLPVLKEALLFCVVLEGSEVVELGRGDFSSTADFDLSSDAWSLAIQTNLSLKAEVFKNTAIRLRKPSNLLHKMRSLFFVVRTSHDTTADARDALGVIKLLTSKADARGLV